MTKKFYPVVHIINSKQTLANVRLAKDVGADGTFLINHHGHPPEFLVAEVISLFQDDSFSVGINYLMRSSANVWTFNDAKQIGCRMLWADDAGTDSNPYQAYGNHILDLQEKSGIEFFGGVHFKYQQKPNRTLSESLNRAFPYVRYPTLSGRGTGIAAEIELMREAALAWQDEQESDSDSHTAGLAIASGISIENVENYLPYIDAFLVASSIIDPNRPNEYFDPIKINQLCKKIKSYET